MKVKTKCQGLDVLQQSTQRKLSVKALFQQRFMECSSKYRCFLEDLTFPVPPLRPWQTIAQSLGKSQMAISLSLPRGDRKNRLRLPPPQPAVAKSWHCQEDRERKEEDGVWPSLRVPPRNRLHLLIWAKSDGEHFPLFPFYTVWI